DLIGFNLFSPETTIYFHHESCPNSLAFIFKNIQSLTRFSQLSNSLKKTVINKNQTTLEQFIKKNTRSESFLGIGNTVINIGIILKYKKIYEKY
ncbi:MAG: hypothetical protein PHH73_02865, partial [Candidatus Rickettsiella isopodorum]|nr:hypothetical protein [Candidatus Rickettsiella isopodorum]